MLENFEKIYASVLTGKEDLRKKEVQVLCPFHDDKNASMSINIETGLYHCFACKASGSAIGFYMKYNNVSYGQALKELEMDGKIEHQHHHNKQIIAKKEPVRVDTDYSDYCFKVWNDTISSEEHFAFYCKKLYELRGITMPTAIACCIGYDPKKGWIFPVTRYNDKKCVGYEIREKNFQHFVFKNGSETKCYKAENTPSCICWIYEGERKKAIFCEGFVDSYKMYQYQLEKLQKAKGQWVKVDCSILTSSCGVKHIPELVENAKLWNDFDEIIFCLDNDPPSREVTEKLMGLPHEGKFKFYNGLLEGEDFENAYDRRLKEMIYC